jgi:hypothetical protein
MLPDVPYLISMKTIYKLLLRLWCLLLLSALPQGAAAQLLVADLIKAGVSKAIKAMDLKVQRLQNEAIQLQNAQKALENELSLHQLQEIADWSERQRAQYAEYFREWGEMRASLSSSQRLREAWRCQQAFARDYQATKALLSKDPKFSQEERRHLEALLASLLRRAHLQVDQLLLVTSPHKTRMRDADRLAFLVSAAEGLENSLRDLRRLRQQLLSLSLQRARNRQEISSLLRLYGLTPNEPAP